MYILWVGRSIGLLPSQSISKYVIIKDTTTFCSIIKAPTIWNLMSILNKFYLLCLDTINFQIKKGKYIRAKQQNKEVTSTTSTAYVHMIHENQWSSMQLTA